MSDDGREREVRDAPMEAAPERAERPVEKFKCFVGGIPWALDDRQLREAFAEFNPADSVVMVDKMTGRSRGFGFVMFTDKRDQDAAIDRLHNTELDGRRISVTRAVPQAETAPGTPADALRRGQFVPRDAGRQGGYSRGGGGGGYGGGGGGYAAGGGGGGYGRSDRGGGYGGGRDDYYRGGGGASGGYGYGDRGGGYGGYDQRGGGYSQGGYDQRGGYGGYDYGSGGYAGGGGGYAAGGSGYGGYAAGYDQRGGGGSSYGGGYDDRSGYGAERGHADRRGAGPYDRR